MNQIASIPSSLGSDLDTKQVHRAQPTQEQPQTPRQEQANQKRIREGESADTAGREQGEERHLAQMDREELESIRETLNEGLEQINVGLQFTENQDVEEMVVKVVNKDTGDVIRQIPPEAMLKMAKKMEELSGVLVDTWG